MLKQELDAEHITLTRNDRAWLESKRDNRTALIKILVVISMTAWVMWMLLSGGSLEQVEAYFNWIMVFSVIAMPLLFPLVERFHKWRTKRTQRHHHAFTLTPSAFEGSDGRDFWGDIQAFFVQDNALIVQRHGGGATHHSLEGCSKDQQQWLRSLLKDRLTALQLGTPEDVPEELKKLKDHQGIRQ